MTEQELEQLLIAMLSELKYIHRADIRDRVMLEANFRENFEALNHVRLTDAEFRRLLDDIVTPDVFTAATMLRARNDFIRDDGVILDYTLVNIKDWYKNTFEVVNQLRIKTDNRLPTLRRDTAHKRHSRRADRVENPRHQSPPGTAVDRGLQEGPRKRLHVEPPVLCAGVHRVQPHRNLLLRQQQPALSCHQAALRLVLPDAWTTSRPTCRRSSGLSQGPLFPFILR
jgi:hypothetical protein